MPENDELTSTDIKRLLVAKWPNVRKCIYISYTKKRTWEETEWVYVLSEGNSAVINQPCVKKT